MPIGLWPITTKPDGPILEHTFKLGGTTIKLPTHVTKQWSSPWQHQLTEQQNNWTHEVGVWQMKQDDNNDNMVHEQQQQSQPQQQLKAMVKGTSNGLSNMFLIINCS